MRCASISIGIVDYQDAYYRSSSMRLKYAVEDAEAFHRYASAAWSGSNHVHIVLPREGEPTRRGVETAFATISCAGAFDLFLVYMCGHGEIDGWFCLADAHPGSASLDGPMIDALLGSVRAARILVLIDCCHAESIAAGARFFSNLSGSAARLVIASSRADQIAWEDDKLRRSLFSDVLIRALSTDSDIADSMGLVDLEAALLPRLREQVPLNAAALKAGQRQEPVAGGLSVSATKLPVVASRSLGRELSVAETVRRRVRRILSIGAVAAAVTIVAIDGMVYHLAVSGTGEILVRPGLSTTYVALPLHLGAEVDTGFVLADLKPTADSFAAALGRASMRGLIGHLDSRGLRPWLRDLEGGLARPRFASASMMAAGQSAALRPDDDAPPSDEVVFLASLSGDSTVVIGGQVYPLNRKPDLDCSATPASDMDFRILSAETEVFARDATWLAATAPLDANGRAASVFELSRIAAYRWAHQKDPDRRASEFSAYAHALARILSDAPSRSTLKDALTSALDALDRGWCAAHGRLAAALLIEDKQRRGRIETLFLNDFRSLAEADPGEPANAGQQFAALALAEMGRRGLLTGQTLEYLETVGRREGLDLSKASPVSELIRAIAPGQPLTLGLVTALIERMTSSSGMDDFAPVAAFAALAANVNHLDRNSVAEIRRWAAEQESAQRTMSDFHRGLGHLAALDGALSPSRLAILTARLSPASRFPPRASNYRGEMVIIAGDEDALGALGRAAAVTDLPEEVAQRLANAAMGRPDLSTRAAVLRGLALQWYRGVSAPALDGAVIGRLVRARHDAERRNFEADVAAARLSLLDESLRRPVLSRILGRWHDEAEPELRIALAKVIAWTRKACEGCG
ncbi:caspase family protein [Bradyrhizobium sp. WSM 1738]|uniref:caspase family protein n=1 Tax=Bradyrhizobium hereditatis TaxID=2821405 RepID=UPI001CE35D18|nr:caspase family protein [Bradyrhizobium hereditatis]MCA6115228.1 caspase family protein [Bradyrhizobium hereditatis]